MLLSSLLCCYRVFAGAVADGGCVKAIRVPDGKRISNSRIKPKGDIANEAVAAGEGGNDTGCRISGVQQGWSLGFTGRVQGSVRL